tara:strand:+ start:1936 stop:2460 length:525 start_codon:yes stop_codon:yes gene_type:complete
MEERLFKLGYRDVEIDRSKLSPIILGTNQLLMREYRMGKAGLVKRPVRFGSLQGEQLDTGLLLLVRLYRLHSGGAWGNYTYGVSFYKPLPSTKPEQLQIMIGPRALPTPLGSNPYTNTVGIHGSTSWDKEVWRCPEGYREYKQHFWGEFEANAFYTRFLCDTPQSYWRIKGSLP